VNKWTDREREALAEIMKATALGLLPRGLSLAEDADPSTGAPGVALLLSDGSSLAGWFPNIEALAEALRFK
tara:strand:- start:1149 stop:1361 length:213 start_codon:yes stop_codon:yes gene_type:complete